MDKFVIQGGRPLEGDVSVDGAKNAALPIMAAALAVDGKLTLKRVPDLVDVKTMTMLLRSMGATVRRDVGEVSIDASGVSSFHADYELVRRMRASICVLGPLLARFGKATVSLPGGCNIGHRPIDLHLRGLAALGAELKVEAGYVVAKHSGLRGAEIFLGGPSGSSVTGTCNVMVAASVASGTSVIHSAACEPEVRDLGRFLVAAGARISGLGTPTIEIQGVSKLHAADHTIIPDRIEAATLAIAAAATRGHITIRECAPENLTSVIEALQRMGVQVTADEGRLTVDGAGPLCPIDVNALPYPGIPTDTQAQLMALLTTIRGSSIVRDTVFPDRFLHVGELMRMGAELRRQGDSTVVSGGSGLNGATVMASDLRASAALVIAGLAAKGETQIRRIYHLDRGYAGLERKLAELGADVIRCRDRSLEATLPQPHFIGDAGDSIRSFSSNASAGPPLDTD